MAHLEILPPSIKSGVKDLPSYDDVGLWEVTCLNSGKSFFTYSEEKYWNLENKDDFFRRVLKIWDKDTLVKGSTEQNKEQRMELEDFIKTARIA